MNKFIQKRDKFAKGIFLLCAVFSIFALVSITVFLFANGIPFIHKIGFFNFIFGTDWQPISDTPSFGIFPMIVTSLFVTALSVLIGVTIGLLTSICLFKFCNKKIVVVIKQMINLLAGIPSVVFGLFGLTIIVPFLRDFVSPYGIGYGILAASIVLGIMILPTIVSVSLEAMTSVPNSYFEGALALGATKEQATFKVMLKSAKSGIYASVVLAIGRAIGETMAVIMVIGGSPEMPNSIFQSVRTLTANIAMGATELMGDAKTALIATGVVLFVFTFLLNICFTLLKEGKKERKRKKKNNMERLTAKKREEEEASFIQVSNEVVKESKREKKDCHFAEKSKQTMSSKEKLSIKEKPLVIYKKEEGFKNEEGFGKNIIRGSSAFKLSKQREGGDNNEKC